MSQIFVFSYRFNFLFHAECHDRGQVAQQKQN